MNSFRQSLSLLLLKIVNNTKRWPLVQKPAARKPPFPSANNLWMGDQRSRLYRRCLKHSDRLLRIPPEIFTCCWIEGTNVPRGAECNLWGSAIPSNWMKAFIQCLCLLAVLYHLVSCSSKAGPQELVVGMDLSYPPFETIDESGKPAGISVELAKALADALGRPLRIDNIQFVGLIPSLQNGQIDCIISSMTDTPERRQSIGFSDPYLSIGLALLVGAQSDIRSPYELDQASHTVVVRQGTTGELWARAHLKEAKVFSVDKENAAVLEVIQNKADAFIYDQMSVWKNWKQNPNTTRVLLTPLQKENWAVGVRRDNDELRLRINDFLKQFRANGGFEKLGERYLAEQKEAFRQENIPFYF
jgi:polar amino acid transport system substrate-binding protein